MEMKKLFYIVGVLTVLAIASFDGAYGAGECGKANPNMEAMKLIPCASAAQDANAPVSSKCCAQRIHCLEVTRTEDC
ncbi:Hypothetical predicted protein [Olea europaea subsp. europaea]|uniref:Uncharacterized protein n=1 Tax=Olea europaea subsp. europaea TaxID=158383 RepID=A0A8S0TCL2_OLEEU|nr:Hypothetical predicted protein [Olea europaea subsp. europaea]